MKVCLVAAVADNSVIGLNGKIPWHLPEDLTWFKSLTAGHVVIMGRKTYDSIGKPLPNRINIVISSKNSLSASGCIISGSFAEALKTAKNTGLQNVFIIGGYKVYQEALLVA